MRAAVYNKKGVAADVIAIKDIQPMPPQSGEVMIRLHTSGINPSDVKIRAGLSVGGDAMPFPEIIPHSDGAGVVETAGTDTNFEQGQRVWVFNGAWMRAFGTGAQYITLPANQVCPLPDNVSFAHGACLGIPAMTAAHAVMRGGVIEGKTLLISSGGGVVGRYCVEIARSLGAKKIITTASSELSQQTARKAGADTVLDYQSPDLAQSILDASDGGVDHAIEAEFGTNITTLATTIKTGGSIAAYGSAVEKTPTLPFYDFMFKNITLTMLLVYLLNDEDRKATIAVLSKLLADGGITENIAASYPLADCAAAHEAVEGAKKSGSIILDCT